ncbi:hypothetical protein M011DRAFT_58861 [Sporormia fimetaria CBS 119925]|uniref:Uncharacterized protein n=1 Tax=Sporormia fimetaria CBS 119925 TaxID=1340428 RepID=A0A6A6V9V5_9PLEO|nr:hypothetical protein M011DRAFT_58861 [Sporormia fimetaria CBS 119925]
MGMERSPRPCLHAVSESRLRTALPCPTKGTGYYAHSLTIWTTSITGRRQVHVALALLTSALLPQDGRRVEAAFERPSSMRHVSHQSATPKTSKSNPRPPDVDVAWKIQQKSPLNSLPPISNNPEL